MRARLPTGYCPKCFSGSLVEFDPFGLFGSDSVFYRCESCGFSFEVLNGSGGGDDFV